MPGVHITQIREEQTDPLARYERRPVLASKALTPMALAVEKCPGCDGPMSLGERDNGCCEECDRRYRPEVDDPRALGDRE